VITKAEEKYLYKLRIEDIGLIWDRYKDHREDKKCFVLMAKISNGSTIGWGLLYYNKTHHEWSFSIYVKRSYRRKGIGSKIYRKMKRKHYLKDNNI
jgi:GNAT superfamily N-acetyltransferase